LILRLGIARSSIGLPVMEGAHDPLSLGDIRLLPQ
jgi:hypothetical protein